ncbi:MAG: hypothetical protein DRO95_06160 [Candidatus Altiarchaeales archaeon]|nr:MAG: hypothetical protein DRO95_06160 [Candidatus Altiarchaeales archaeon]
MRHTTGKTSTNSGRDASNSSTGTNTNRVSRINRINRVNTERGERARTKGTGRYSVSYCGSISRDAHARIADSGRNVWNSTLRLFKNEKMETKICEACGYDNPTWATVCERCGSSLLPKAIRKIKRVR